MKFGNTGNLGLKQRFNGCGQAGAGRNPRRMEKGAGCWPVAAATGAGYPLVTVCFSMLSKDKEVLSCHAGDQGGTTLSCVDMAPIKN